MAEVAEKIVEVENPNPHTSYSKGQKVTISLKKSLGYRALFLGYLLPFLLVFFTLVLSIQITQNEGLSALLSILIVFPYYSILYARRDRIKSSFRFYIKQ